MQNRMKQIDDLIRSKGEFVHHLHYKYGQKLLKSKSTHIYDLSGQIPRKARKRIITNEIIECIIQATYLIYSAYIYRMNINIQQYYFDYRQLNRFNYQENVVLNIQGKYTIQEMQKKQDQDSFVIQKIKSQIKKILDIYKKFQNNQNLSIQCFQSQFERIFKVIESKKDIDSKKIMLALQQTDIFRKFSTLVNIKNASILNIISPSMQEQQNLLFLFKTKELQKQIINRYEKTLLIQQKNKCQSLLQKSIFDFFNHQKFKKRLKVNKVTSIDSNDPFKFKLFIKFYQKNVPLPQSNSQQKQYKQKMAKEKITFQKQTQKILKITIVTDPNIKTIIPISSFEFLIEYSKQKKILCVKLLTDIVLNAENSDLLMYQINHLDHRNININIQISQKSIQGSDKQQNNRILTLKQVADPNYLMIKGKKMQNLSSLIDNILISMDYTLVIYKIIEQQLKKSNVEPEDYQITKKLKEKVDHYTALINLITNLVYNKTSQTNQAKEI